MLAQPFHGTVLVKMMLARQNHDDLIWLVFTLTDGARLHPRLSPVKHAYNMLCCNPKDKLA